MKSNRRLESLAVELEIKGIEAKKNHTMRLSKNE